MECRERKESRITPGVLIPASGRIGRMESSLSEMRKTENRAGLETDLLSMSFLLSK